MLYRTINNTRICITQPTHAWAAGQLARVWGNETFGTVTPYEAVCLGAEQHDIGWIPWEAAPTLNPNTGYPHSFMEVAPEIHTQLWAGAKHLAMPMGRYVALLVSLHGTGLYERFTHWKQSAQSTRVVEAFLHAEKQFQQQLIALLEQDPAYQPDVTPDRIAHNQRLVATFDALSLAICMGIAQPRSFESVPIAAGETMVTLMPMDDDPTRLSVEPWCFQTNKVSVVFEGRILKQKARGCYALLLDWRHE
ncbi:DUF3891 family protein [Cyanobacteria bacterium FACHB-63]|nr:DUF3891 family protein [Cyanobacteria bacterium FACHB-63]